MSDRDWDHIYEEIGGTQLAMHNYANYRKTNVGNHQEISQMIKDYYHTLLAHFLIIGRHLECVKEGRDSSLKCFEGNNHIGESLESCQKFKIKFGIENYNFYALMDTSNNNSNKNSNS